MKWQSVDTAYAFGILIPELKMGIRASTTALTDRHLGHHAQFEGAVKPQGL